MRYYLLTGILLFLVVFTAACRDLLTDHNIGMDGVEHGEKLYDGVKNCTSCHGINLNGNGPIPSCYSCHEALWDDSLHTQVRGGIGHRPGFLAQAICADCHGGSSLQGSRSRPSCYECHGDVWTALEIHTISQDGALHAAGLTDPFNNCASCHGSGLTGSGNAPSCYQCHGDEWNEDDDDD